MSQREAVLRQISDLQDAIRNYDQLKKRVISRPRLEPANLKGQVIPASNEKPNLRYSRLNLSLQSSSKLCTKPSSFQMKPATLHTPSPHMNAAGPRAALARAHPCRTFAELPITTTPPVIFSNRSLSTSFARPVHTAQQGKPQKTQPQFYKHGKNKLINRATQAAQPPKEVLNFSTRQSLERAKRPSKVVSASNSPSIKKLNTISGAMQRVSPFTIVRKQRFSAGQSRKLNTNQAQYFSKRTRSGMKVVRVGYVATGQGSKISRTGNLSYRRKGLLKTSRESSERASGQSRVAGAVKSLVINGVRYKSANNGKTLVRVPSKEGPQQTSLATNQPFAPSQVSVGSLTYVKSRNGYSLSKKPNAVVRAVARFSGNPPSLEIWSLP
mmetsp:Transcript_22428/g.38494  ORF Transcript_22428/g.38494 Transcript_22428/m.38494 type:complete len:383 (-) Transcript_22428:36-1184(-)